MGRADLAPSLMPRLARPLKSPNTAIRKGSERLGSEGLMELIRKVLGSSSSSPADQVDERFLDQVIDQVRELNGRDLDDDLAILALGYSSPAG